MLNKQKIIGAAVLICSLTGGPGAFAHATLVTSTPAKDASVPAPRSIRLTFSEKIAPSFSGFRLSMDDGMVIDFATKVSDDGKTLTGTPTSSFMKGKYTLAWHATAVDDGHRTEGSFDFTVK
jgi:methionine-rich copper-binding protein CopC